MKVFKPMRLLNRIANKILESPSYGRELSSTVVVEIRT